MLLPNHPDTPFTASIAVHFSKVLDLARNMTIADSDLKAALFRNAMIEIEEMESISREHWSNDSDRLKSIEKIRECLKELAAKPSNGPALFNQDLKLCANCDSLLIDFPEFFDAPYCQVCVEVMLDGIREVNEAFHLDAI